MKQLYVGITDRDWFEYLSSQDDHPEVNFWQPGGNRRFAALEEGELFLFKLHSPHNYIVGGGIFSLSSLLPVSIAWDTFGTMNGVRTLVEMRARIERYRREQPEPQKDYTIGNIILTEPFFFKREAWIRSPADFAPNIVQGKRYDPRRGTGLALWQAVSERLTSEALLSNKMEVADGVVKRMFGDPVLMKPRRGQGSFRLKVTDEYGRQCAVTREHTLLVLEAAHIRPVSDGGQHDISNGLLLRSDVHTLFDKGYVTIDTNFKFRVSRKLEEEWKNGRIYYALDGQKIHVPRREDARPSREVLQWHGDTTFRG